jgi:hypothetical protein
MQMDYTAIFKGLNEAGLSYLVSGGLALNLHGVPRLSFDLDLIPGPKPQNVKGIVDLLEAWGYRAAKNGETLADPVGRRRLASEGVRAVPFACAEHLVTEVDLAVAMPAPYAELMKRSLEAHLFGEKVPVLSLRDLATVKKARGSKEDEEDLRGMEFLAALREGRDLPGFPAARREQMVKFQQWPAENRIDWLLTSAQLQRQMEEGREGGRGGGLKRRRIKGLRHTDLS